jgi:hypothetical protein
VVVFLIKIYRRCILLILLVNKIIARLTYNFILLQKKKKTKTVVEKYWDWELTNETQPIWVSLEFLNLLVYYDLKMRSLQEKLRHLLLICAASQPEGNHDRGIQ